LETQKSDLDNGGEDQPIKPVIPLARAAMDALASSALPLAPVQLPPVSGGV
jgi:hypothetical protein